LNGAVEAGAGQAGRRRGSIALTVLGAGALLLGSLFLYASFALFDSDNFAKRAASALEDEQVREPLAEAVVDGLIKNAEPDLVNARPVLVSVTSGILDNGAFRTIFREAAERAHRTLFTREGEELVLNLADGASLAIDALRSVAPRLAKDIPKDSTARLNQLVESEAVLDLAKTAESVRFLGIVLPIVGLILLAAAIALDRDRRRGFLTVSIAIAAAAAVGLAALFVARTLVLGQFDTELRDAAAGVWDAFLGDLATWFLIGLGGALIAAAAISTRARLEPGEPLRRLAAFAGREPTGTLAKLVRALVVLLLGILIVVSPEAFVRVLAVAVGAYAIFYALSELLLLIAPPAPPGERMEKTRRRRLVPALGAFAVIAAIVVVVVLVSGGDGQRGSRARPAASIERCNGFAKLCDRRINEVAFPSVHNAMSAANDGFLIANNQKPIPDQLEAGVRGLLIDAHYGREGSRGEVVTDLDKEGKTRGEIADAVGEDFVQTAERLVGRISGTGGQGEPGTYFCHVFCELGAVPLVEELRRIREFLETHPDEVLVLFIEDYVKPADIERGFADAGLVDYAHVQRPGVPLPTLREMIASGKRILVMAENHGGGTDIPWYLQGFDYAQETPFTFNTVGELKAKASCDENRGEPDNPLFQINHWVEAIPRSPKTAARVNSFDFLHDRARSCDRERDLLANLVAVDFWEQGDLFEVTNALNGLDRDAEPTYSETG
jgi:hypothetical protein